MESSSRLLKLIDIANDDTRRWIKAKRLKIMRARFDKLKRAHTIQRCYVCGSKGQCFHHIVPISRGGSYHMKNVVSLCHYCHSRIHPWLRNDEVA